MTQLNALSGLKRSSPLRPDALTPTLQKSRMPQILGVEGEAVVLYREPSTTKEMRYPRLSRRVNKMAAFCCFQDPTSSELQQGIENEKK
jgi:hypothetical protein